jgi:hypothetical protein
MRLKYDGYIKNVAMVIAVIKRIFYCMRISFIQQWRRADEMSDKLKILTYRLSDSRESQSLVEYIMRNFLACTLLQA